MSQAVTAIIPTYNRAALVRRAIDSALRATTSHDEILVVDDGSTDDTTSRIKDYGDRVRVLQVPHRGAGAARNAGVAAAKHDWIAFLDSDDEWDPDKIAMQRALLAAREDVAYVFSDFRVIHEQGATIPRYLRNWMSDKRPWQEITSPPCSFRALAGAKNALDRDFDVYIGDFYTTLLENFCIPTFTLMFRRSRSVEARFAEDLPTYEDYEFFGRLTHQKLGAYLDVETATQHGHGLPRLTSATQVHKLDAQMTVTARIWGSDAAFLEAHGGMYAHHWDTLKQRRSRARISELLLLDDLPKARCIAASAEGLSWKIRALLALPHPMARWALMVYRRTLRHQ